MDVAFFVSGTSAVRLKPGSQNASIEIEANRFSEFHNFSSRTIRIINGLFSPPHYCLINFLSKLMRSSRSEVNRNTIWFMTYVDICLRLGIATDSWCNPRYFNVCIPELVDIFFSVLTIVDRCANPMRYNAWNTASIYCHRDISDRVYVCMYNCS